MADNGQLEHLKPGHEEKDVNPIAITRFGIGLTLTIVVAAFVLWGLFHYFVGRDERIYGAGAPLSPTSLSPAKEPPQPRLQQAPPVDLRQMRAAEDQILHHYSWVDRDKGVVRIPIERAMDILAERGLPTRSASEEALPMASEYRPGWVEPLPTAGEPSRSKK